MVQKFADRVYETSTTAPGTSTSVALNGVKTGPWQNFNVIGNGNTTDLCLIDNTNKTWEVQKQSTFTLSGRKISRLAANVIDSSSGPGVLVNFAGTVDVIGVFSSTFPDHLGSSQVVAWTDTNIRIGSGSVDATSDHSFVLGDASLTGVSYTGVIGYGATDASAGGGSAITIGRTADTLYLAGALICTQNTIQPNGLNKDLLLYAGTATTVDGPSIQLSPTSTNSIGRFGGSVKVNLPAGGGGRTGRFYVYDATPTVVFSVEPFPKTINLGLATYGYSVNGQAAVASTFSMPSGFVLAWNADSGISRLAAGSIAIGNGTAADVSGTLNWKNSVITDAGTIQVGTGTGTKIGTATNQLLGFWNATPIVQPVGSTDILTGLINAGLRASGANPPLNMGTGLLTCGGVSMNSGKVIAWNADTGIARNAAGILELNNGTAGTPPSGGAGLTVPNPASGAGINLTFTAANAAAGSAGNGGNVAINTGAGNGVGVAGVLSLQTNATQVATCVISTGTNIVSGNGTPTGGYIEFVNSTNDIVSGPFVERIGFSTMRSGTPSVISICRGRVLMPNLNNIVSIGNILANEDASDGGEYGIGWENSNINGVFFYYNSGLVGGFNNGYPNLSSKSCRMVHLGMFGWTDATDSMQTLDTAISRLAAGSIAIGNGTQGDFSGTLKLTTLNIASGGSTSIGAGVGSVKMTSANAATNAAWIPIQYAGTTYYVPGWTTNNP
jgi:hypothetical protein